MNCYSGFLFWPPGSIEVDLKIQPYRAVNGLAAQCASFFCLLDMSQVGLCGLLAAVCSLLCRLDQKLATPLLAFTVPLMQKPVRKPELWPKRDLFKSRNPTFLSSQVLKVSSFGGVFVFECMHVHVLGQISVCMILH